MRFVVTEEGAAFKAKYAALGLRRGLNSMKAEIGAVNVYEEKQADETRVILVVNGQVKGSQVFEILKGCGYKQVRDLMGVDLSHPNVA